MSKPSKLFTPLQIGPCKLSNRIVMAPLTRCRADENNVPQPLMNKYYTQRACEPGTMLLTEATFIHQRAGAMPYISGIWSEAQIAAWKEIVASVHAAGSFIFLQLWALGRSDSVEWKEKRGTGDLLSSYPTPIAEDRATPRAMTEKEIEEFIGFYATAARNAVHGAGFDGVEIHGANGYLVDQFTQDVVNKRTDGWGGSVEKRARFAIEVTKAVVDAVGAERTGIRLSPWSVFQNMKMADPVPQFSYLMEELKKLRIAYVHLVESRVAGSADAEPTEKCDPFIELWGKTSPILLAGGFSPDSAKRCLDEEYTDSEMAVVFGRYFISNPDLVYRAKSGIDLNKYDRSTFYTPQNPEGYVDYPFSQEWLKNHPSAAA